MKNKFDGILFDLDGTMWNATEGIRKSWNIAINTFDELKGRELSIEELEQAMGLPMYDIAAKLFPQQSKEKQIEIMEKCCEVENEYLEEHGGILYPELENTLKILSENYKLCIVSNGQDGYIQAFLRAHKLEQYFTDFENWGRNKVPKGENNKLVIARNGLKNAVYVGDTQGDAISAQVAGIPFIYARYGFGTVEKYDYVIDTFADLLKIMECTK